jgi:hypothetical protein
MDTSVPAVCGAEQCAWIALAHHQTLPAALKHYEIYIYIYIYMCIYVYTNQFSMVFCQLRSQNFSFVPSNTYWKKFLFHIYTIFQNTKKLKN